MTMRRLTRQALLLVLVAVASYSAAAIAQSIVERARTQSGREVILRNDGSWIDADTPAPAAPRSGPPHQALNNGAPASPAAASNAVIVHRPEDARVQLSLRRGGFRFWYNSTKWRASPANADGRVQLQLTGHEAYIVLIPEGTPLPIPQLRTVALENARQSGGDARIVAEEMRRVGGREVLLMQINVTLGGSPVAFLGYYYGDPRGSIQAVGYTSLDDLPRYRAALLDGLAGLDLNR